MPGRYSHVFVIPTKLFPLKMGKCNASLVRSRMRWEPGHVPAAVG